MPNVCDRYVQTLTLSPSKHLYPLFPAIDNRIVGTRYSVLLSFNGLVVILGMFLGDLVHRAVLQVSSSCPSVSAPVLYRKLARDVAL